MGCGDLTVAILQYIGKCSLKNTWAAAIKPGRVLAQFFSATAGLYADKLDFFVAQERMKNSHGVGSAADAGDDGIRQTALGFEDLCARLAANDRLKITHHQRIRMRAQHAA